MKEIKMKTKEEKILKRDDRLLKNEKSWRRARIGATFIFFIIIITIFIIRSDNFTSKDLKIEAMVSITAWCFFWLLIIDWLNMRIRHIDSIKLYRKKNSITNEAKATS